MTAVPTTRATSTAMARFNMTVSPLWSGSSGRLDENGDRIGLQPSGQGAGGETADEVLYFGLSEIAGDLLALADRRQKRRGDTTWTSKLMATWRWKPQQ